MAGNSIFRGSINEQPRTINLPVTGALLPGTFVEATATNLVQITTPAGKRPLILGNLDFKDQDKLTAYTTGDTGVAYEVNPNDFFQCALAAATYTHMQPLTIAAPGRLAAAATTNVVVAFFNDTPGAYSAGQLADVVIANFYIAP
jgi:hypothetical protein